MTIDYIELAQQLITLRTTPEHPDELSKALTLVESHCSHLSIERFVHHGSQSLLIHNRPHRPERFRFILNGHVDVIPGNPQHYQPTTRNQRIYGIGALDMKANLAVLVALFSQLAPRIDAPIALQVVSDEERGGFDGTYHQIMQGVRGDFILSAETTNFDIVHQAKGIVWLKVQVTGQTAHGAYPWRGQNAIINAQHLIHVFLTKFPPSTRQVWRTTVNVANIHTSNIAFNKVPDAVEVWFDIRFVPHDSPSILETVRLLCMPYTYEITVHEPPLNTPADHPDIALLSQSVQQVRTKNPRIRAAQGSSDARHYMHVGDVGVEFGAIGGGIASDNEWISIPSLHEFYTILKQVISTIR